MRRYSRKFKESTARADARPEDWRVDGSGIRVPVVLLSTWSSTFLPLPSKQSHLEFCSSNQAPRRHGQAAQQHLCCPGAPTPKSGALIAIPCATPPRFTPINTASLVPLQSPSLLPHKSGKARKSCIFLRTLMHAALLVKLVS